MRFASRLGVGVFTARLVLAYLDWIVSEYEPDLSKLRPEDLRVLDEVGKKILDVVGDLGLDVWALSKRLDVSPRLVTSAIFLLKKYGIIGGEEKIVSPVVKVRFSVGGRVKVSGRVSEEKKGVFLEVFGEGVGEFPLSGNLSDYRFLELIGEGCFGKVFKVERHGKVFALKQPSFLVLSRTLDPNVVEVFKREISIWYLLMSKGVRGIVKLVDGNLKPYPWFVMEYMEGGSLRNKIVKITWSEAVKIAVEIADVLNQIHLLGIRHLDLKPENILLSGEGEVKISDFGLATIQLFVSGGEIPIGTLPYSAPEQIDKEKFGDPDHLTDIYQLGVLLYEMLTGRRPFEGEPHEIVKKICKEKPLPPSKLNKDVPKELDNIVSKMLAKRKEERYETMLDVKRALEKILEKYV